MEHQKTRMVLRTLHFVSDVLQTLFNVGARLVEILGEQDRSNKLVDCRIILEHIELFEHHIILVVLAQQLGVLLPHLLVVCSDFDCQPITVGASIATTLAWLRQYCLKTGVGRYVKSGQNIKQSANAILFTGEL